MPRIQTPYGSIDIPHPLTITGVAFLKDDAVDILVRKRGYREVLTITFNPKHEVSLTSDWYPADWDSVRSPVGEHAIQNTLTYDQGFWFREKE